MRLALDTNVLLSALLSSSSPPAQLFALWRNRAFELVTSAEQIDESLTRCAVSKNSSAACSRRLPGEKLVNQLRDLAIVVAKLPKVDRSPDPDDNHPLLALAEAGEAQFLATGDKQLLGLKLHKFTRIVLPQPSSNYCVEVVKRLHKVFRSAGMSRHRREWSSPRCRKLLQKKSPAAAGLM